MNPQAQFCPNLACYARGQLAQGNISVHDQKKARYKCQVCGTTFAQTKGTPFYRAKVEVTTIVLVLTLLAHGCPIAAIVAAFGFQARTVARWQQAAGQHAETIHDHLVLQARDQQQVQADGLRVKTQRGIVWQAMAMTVNTRLWLGGVISPSHDKALIAGLVAKIRQACAVQPLLFAVDGLVTYVKQVQRSFRVAVKGRRGRPRLNSWPGLVLGQVVKQHRGRHLVGILRRLVVGTAHELAARLASSPGQQLLNTSYIERLNGTFRQRLGSLARRSRNLGRLAARLHTGMYLVGTVYNFCSVHDSLSTKEQLQTPAMAAGISDHVWSVAELLWYKVAPPRYRRTKRGRPKKEEVRWLQ